METPKLLRLSILTLSLVLVGAWYVSINQFTASCAQFISIQPTGTKLRFVAAFDSEPRKEVIEPPVDRHYKGPLEPPTNY